MFELLSEFVSDFLLSGTLRIVAAVFCILIEGGKALARLTRISQSTPPTGPRAVDYVDAILFPDEDLQPR
jgi:hypothetical protein